MRKAGYPERTILFQPRVHRFQRRGIELIKAITSFPPFLHQVGASQQTQMPGYGGTGNWKGLRNLTGRATALPQQIQDGSPRGIGQGMKGGFRGICDTAAPHNV